MEEEKFDYSLDLNTSMYDMCHCSAKCITPCARKKAPVERIYTTSDFSSNCSKFKSKEDN